MPNGDGTGPRWSNGNLRYTGKRDRIILGCRVKSNLTKDEEREWVSSQIDNLNAVVAPQYCRAIS